MLSPVMTRNQQIVTTNLVGKMTRKIMQMMKTVKMEKATKMMNTTTI